MNLNFPLRIFCLVAFLAFCKGEPIKVTTYNTAMFFQVPFMEDRLAWFAQNIAHEIPDSDVICLQELWGRNVLEPFIYLLSPEYPYSYSMLNEQMFNETQMACELGLVNAFNGCLTGPGQNCYTGSFDFDFAACIARSCEPLDGVPLWNVLRDSGCQDCVLQTALVDGIDLPSAIFKCMTKPAPEFEQTFGLLMLSKTPITDTKFVQYDDIASKGALKGDISGIQYICTHLVNTHQWTPDGSARQEHVFGQQITELKAAMSLLTPGNKNAVIAGDLNAGPKTTNLDPTDPETYHFLGSKGFMEAYTKYTGLPTFNTNDNILIKPNEHLNGEYLLDHIFVKELSLCVIDTMRIFDEAVVATEAGNVYPSDHHGQQATIAQHSCEEMSKHYQEHNSLRRFTRQINPAIYGTLGFGIVAVVGILLYRRRKGATYVNVV